MLRELSLLVESTPDLYGLEVNERTESIVVVHRAGADLEMAQLRVERMLNTAEETIRAENLAVAESDLSDLSANERQALERDMAELNSTVLADVDLTVGFHPVCRPVAGDIDAIQAAVESFDWAEGSVWSNVELAVQRDLVDGVVEVVVASSSEDTAAIRQRLQERFGPDVTLVIDPDHARFADALVTSKSNVPGRSLQAGRYADKSPHLGGVQFGDWNFRKGACTTGFAINLPGGGRAMLTAGHCQTVLPIGTYVYSGVFNRGDSHNYYGQFYQSYWIDRDVGLIGSGTQTYRRKIYTDPDPSGASERLVTAVWEPWRGAKVCMSGSFTGNVCNGEVVQSFTACFRGGSVSRCGRSYTVRGPQGRSMSQQGDSGGPVYIPHGRSSARALGIISTGLGSETTFVGSQAINKATGGWIASACCDSDTW